LDFSPFFIDIDIFMLLFERDKSGLNGIPVIAAKKVKSNFSDF